MSSAMLKKLGGVKKLRKRCFDTVVGWEWYSGLLARDSVPFASEAGGFGRPKRLKKEPGNKKKAAKVGVDVAGRTVVRQTYFVYEGTPYPHDELFAYEVDASGNGQILAVQMKTTIAGEPQRLGDMRVLKVKRGRVEASDRTKFVYGDDGLLARTEHRHTTLTYTYDELGELLSIKTPRETRYKRAPKGTTMASAMKRIEALLLDEVPSVLAVAAPDEEVCTFALVHSLARDPLPPLIGLALERERSALLKQTDPERAYWDPIEWQLFEDDRFALTSPELIKACEVANHLCVDAGTVQPVRKMLWNVVDSLRDRLPNMIRTSEHFVAMTVHGEHEGLIEDLKRTRRNLSPATKKNLHTLFP